MLLLLTLPGGLIPSQHFCPMYQPADRFTGRRSLHTAASACRRHYLFAPMWAGVLSPLGGMTYRLLFSHPWYSKTETRH